MLCTLLLGMYAVNLLLVLNYLFYNIYKSDLFLKEDTTKNDKDQNRTRIDR